jgi:ketosteroid isomerase-like protein
MIKKIGINLVFFVFIIIFLSMISCKNTGEAKSDGVLLQKDKAFSKMSETEGMHNAFISFISDDGVLLRDNSYPLKGKETLAKLYANSDDKGFTLTWEPLFERLSSAGDIGYTYGTYKYKVLETGDISYGTYVTIWQKGKDGNWKFVLDSGTQGLPDNPESP